jgi:DNA-binding NarL/FixJ family response regulator
VDTNGAMRPDNGIGDNYLSGAISNLLLIDDHPMMVRGLQWLFAERQRQLTLFFANSLDEALEVLAKADASKFLALLDLTMPGYEGMAAFNELSSKQPALRIAIYSGREDAYLIEQAIRQGAAGFVPKSTPPNIVADAVYLMIDGGVYYPSSVLENRYVERLSKPEYLPGSYEHESAHIAHILETMPPRRRDVFNILCRGASNKEICRQLDMNINTVKTHVSLILASFEVNSRQKLSIKTRWGERGIYINTR